MTTDPYILQRYLLMTLDPVHPGAGGYRLGRVDNSIAREPGTRLPKIPGSSLHGAARSYAAYLYETPDCAGQGGHCGKRDCPICYTFGHIAGDTMYSGVVNVFDAHILLFPVHSVAGPVWVSTQARLQEAGFPDVKDAPEKDEQICLTWDRDHAERLNLGWLMLDAAGQVQIDAPTEWQGKEWDSVKGRIVLVTDSLFGHIVNSNLEVRTSVAINPETGAAEDGALYTYEAIPRAAFLTAEVVLDDYVLDEKRVRPFPTEKTGKNNSLPGGKWEGPLDVVKAGLEMIEHLSVGGMGTRGFGRMEIVGDPLTPPLFQEAQP